MSARQLSLKFKSQVLRRLSHKGQASETSLDALISDGKVPQDLKWQPSWCIARGEETILVHVLASQDIPPYLERAIKKLREDGLQNVYVLILARDLILEGTEDAPPTSLPAPYAASAVAEKAMSLGCALAFEADKSVHLVFDGSYTPPPQVCRNRKRDGPYPEVALSGFGRQCGLQPKTAEALKAICGRL